MLVIAPSEDEDTGEPNVGSESPSLRGREASVPTLVRVSGRIGPRTTPGGVKGRSHGS